jgi:hypothetical protein
VAAWATRWPAPHCGRRPCRPGAALRPDVLPHLPVVCRELAAERRQVCRAGGAVEPGRGGAVQHRAAQRQPGIRLGKLDDPGLLRPVNVRGRGDLPEAAGRSWLVHRPDGVDVRVPVQPGGHARMSKEQVAQLRPEDPPLGSRCAGVVDEGLQRMMAEQHDRAIRVRGQLGGQPPELSIVKRALPASVLVYGVDHDAPHDAPVESVVGRSFIGVARRVAVPDRPPGGAEMFLDVDVPRHWRAGRVGCDRQPRAEAHIGQPFGIGSVEFMQRIFRVDAVRRRDELHRPGREVAQPAGGLDRALQQVVVVPVHGIPRQPEPGRQERPSDRSQQPGDLGEAESGSRQVRHAAFGMPVPLVRHVRASDALVAVQVA